MHLCGISTYLVNDIRYKLKRYFVGTCIFLLKDTISTDITKLNTDIILAKLVTKSYRLDIVLYGFSLCGCESRTEECFEMHG